MLNKHYSHEHAEQTLKAGVKSSRHNVIMLHKSVMDMNWDDYESISLSKLF